MFSLIVFTLSFQLLINKLINNEWFNTIFNNISEKNNNTPNRSCYASVVALWLAENRISHGVRGLPNVYTTRESTVAVSTYESRLLLNFTMPDPTWRIKIRKKNISIEEPDRITVRARESRMSIVQTVEVRLKFFFR